ncbi:squalene synthase HpnC [Kaarinaea lacus]
MEAQDSQQVQQAYRHCQNIVKSHYENFPVASLALPRQLRQPISAIYAFARRADDVADEDKSEAALRLQKLDSYSKTLNSLHTRPLEDPVFIALADTIATHDLPLQLFQDLLTAFKQDVIKTRYADFDEVLAYCKNSANPIGRLLLHLTRQASPHNLELSDHICSALQIINFLQDIEQDYYENNRIYLPQDEMLRFGVSETHIAQKRCDDAMQALIDFQIQRTKIMMHQGLDLGQRISGRFGLQLRIMINGGLTILYALEKQQKNCFSRPRLSAKDWYFMLWNALWKSNPKTTN